MDKLWQWLLGTSDRPGMDEAGTWSVKFAADYGPYATLAILAALGVMVWLTIRSYRREGEHRALVKYGLAAVRLLIIGLCVAALFRPAAVLSNNRVLHSAVIVLIDDSQSMTVKDQYDDIAYRADIAQLLDAGASLWKVGDASRLDVVKAALLRQGGAVARLAQEHPIRVMKFSPASTGANEVDSLGVVEAMIDEDAAVDMNAPVPSAFHAMLENVRGAGYSTNLASAIRRALEGVQGQRIAALVVISDGRQTTEDAGNRLAHAIEYAQARGIPLYSVVAGDPTPTKNLTVLSLQAPREMRKGTRVEMTAKLSHRHLDGQPVTVKLYRTRMEGGEVVDVPTTQPADTTENATNGATNELPTDATDEATPVAESPRPNPAAPILQEDWEFTGVEATITLEPTDAAKGIARIQDVVLKIDEVPATLGTWKYKAVTDVLPQESNTEDNESAPVQVAIVDSLINVLLISGDGGWEFQYLRNSIQRQPELYRLSVWQQNAEKGISQAASSPEMKLETLPHELPELVYNDQTKKGYHVIILYDPQHTEGGFDHAFCANLKAYADQGKGGVLYIAGNKYTTMNLVLHDKAIGNLQDILPVQLSPNMTMMDLLTERQAEAWRVSLTLAGRDHQVTRLGSSAEDAERVWGSARVGGILPGIYWSHPVARVKPLAHVLLENTNPRASSGGAMEALLAVHMYGKGPVVYLGTDDTWRWRFVDDAAYYRQFWNNMLSFLAAQKSSRVTITTGGDRFTSDKPISVDVEAYDSKFQPLTDPSFTVEVWNISGAQPVKVADLVLPQSRETVITDIGGAGKAVETKTVVKPGRYATQFVPPTVGKYELCIADRRICQPKQIEVIMQGDEFLRTEADEETMKLLVGERPDRFMRISSIDRLADQIPVNRIITVESRSFELWDIPLLLITLLALLVFEWVLRKKYNMA
ncbi:MAG: VWA domain-containing protein [Phycisphaerae bacterium]|nr:VWA domain-containing protein [Phycisphaerae bacterium]